MMLSQKNPFSLKIIVISPRVRKNKDIFFLYWQKFVMKKLSKIIKKALLDHEQSFQRNLF